MISFIEKNKNIQYIVIILSIIVLALSLFTIFKTSQEVFPTQNTKVIVDPYRNSKNPDIQPRE